MIKQNAKISVKNPSPNAAPAPTEAPLLSDLVRLGTALRPKIAFRGWSRALGWESWVREMVRREDVVKMWRKAGIEDSILGSITHFYPDHHALEALVGFWSPTSRTFIFPWGEAAFTLEDAHILSNLPIRGSKLDRELTDEEKELSERLHVEREKIRMLHLRAKLGRKVTLDIWLDWFLDLRGEDELKLLGFLTYWLAKNVIPVSSSGEVPNVVFRLAARLSCGDRIALAPIVTANIFNDLTRITNLVVNMNGKKGSNTVTIWTPFWLIQAWIWERFESLRPVKPDTIMLISRSRISRWSNRKHTSSYDEAIHTYWEERSYTWRPYSKNSANWIEPCWYHLESRTICTSEDTPHRMDDFLTVISPSILQGFYGDHIISSERYQPYRVARQFGYDQGIPFSRDPLASLWIESNACRVGDKIHIPEITRSGNPSGEYLAWWQKCRSQYQNSLLACAVPAVEKKTFMRQTEETDNYSPFPVPTTQKSFEPPKPIIKCEEKNNISALLEKQRSDQRKDRNGNDRYLNVSQKDKGKGYDSIVTKSFVDRIDWMEKASGRKRKLEDERTATRREYSAALGEDITVTVLDIKGFSDYEEKEGGLVEELEEFERRGLLSEWVPGSPKFEMEDNIRLHYNDAISINEDPYGQEAIRMYPKFFELIPQRPHYKGLLDKKVSENTRRDVYISKWYKLVDLMRRTLETSCQTPASEFRKLMQEAERYKELGFNVKHIIVRLKEPRTRLRRLEEARLRLEEARKNEIQAREVQTLKRHINDLGSKLKLIEEKLESSQGAFGINQQENTLDIMALRKEVEAAETNLSVVEGDVEAMSISY